MKTNDEIAAELKELRAEFGKTGASDSTFHVPGGYFSAFPAKMTAIIQAMNADVSFDPDISKTGPFLVPEGYFEQLPAMIREKIGAADEIIQDNKVPWKEEHRSGAFSVPPGYFDDFEQILKNRIAREEAGATAETGAISPLLADLREKQPFQVPQGYFETGMLAKNAARPEPKTVEHPAVRSIKWARWAAAAAVLAIFFTGGFHYLNNNPVQTRQQSFEQALAKIPEARIKDWLISNMDEADINNLGSSLVNTNAGNPATKSSLSEEELRDYLEAELY